MQTEFESWVADSGAMATGCLALDQELSDEQTTQQTITKTLDELKSVLLDCRELITMPVEPGMLGT